MTSQSSVNIPKAGLKTAQNSAKHAEKQVMRAIFALPSLKQCDHILQNSAKQVGHESRFCQFND